MKTTSHLKCILANGFRQIGIWTTGVANKLYDSVKKKENR